MGLAAVALCNTVLKLSAKQAKDLPIEQKYLIATSWSAPLKAYTKEGDHFRITLGEPNGQQLTITIDGKAHNTFYCYAPHLVIKKDGKTVDFDLGEEIDLKVPYFSQRDNFTQNWRTCNTSATAMLIKYLKPNAIAGDDEYLKHVLKEGDSTDHEVHTRLLKRLYGIDSEWRYDLGYDDIDRQLKAGIPTVISLYHKGTISAPAGGHVLIVRGKTRVGIRVNDSWGDLIPLQSLC